MPLALALLLASLALPATSSASPVRVRTDHPRASIDGSPLDFHLVPTGTSLSGAVIGPKKVRVVLRRLADGPGELKVRLRRDGRLEGNVTVGGTPTIAVDGQPGRAGVEVDRIIAVPPGPHTLSVEVLGGDGGLLVAFGEPEPPKRISRRARPPAKTKATHKPRVARKPAAVEQTEPVVTRLGEEDADLPTRGPTKLEEEDDAPEQHEVSVAAIAPPGEPQALPELSSESPSLPKKSSRLPLWVGARAGLASHGQFGTAGSSLGLQLRAGLFTDGAEEATRGFVAGIAADWLRYAMAMEVGASRALPKFRQELTVQAIPIVAELGYALGASDRRLTPVVGLLGGLSVSHVSTRSGLSNAAQSVLSPALGVFAGIEYGIGRNRFGVDVRYLSSRIGDSSVARNFEVGGLIAQASWRYGL